MQSIASKVIDQGHITPDPLLAASDASAAYLFETVVTDVQWSALNIGSLTILINAFSDTAGDWTMWSWRRALTIDGRSMRLALRFSSDFGLSNAAMAQINLVYSRLEGLSARTSPLVKRRDALAPSERRALAGLSTDWRTLSGDTISMLQILEPMVRQRLVRQYATNNQILQQFLDEGIKSKCSRVNRWGEIELPMLAQKRRQARLPTHNLCKLRIGSQIVPATLVDLSQSGAGVTCRKALQIGQEVQIEFADGKAVGARVAWSTEERCGLAFNKLLSHADVMANERRNS